MLCFLADVVSVMRMGFTVCLVSRAVGVHVCLLACVGELVSVGQCWFMPAATCPRSMSVLCYYTSAVIWSILEILSHLHLKPSHS